MTTRAFPPLLQQYPTIVESRPSKVMVRDHKLYLFGQTSNGIGETLEQQLNNALSKIDFFLNYHGTCRSYVLHTCIHLHKKNPQNTLMVERIFAEWMDNHVPLRNLLLKESQLNSEHLVEIEMVVALPE